MKKGVIHFVGLFGGLGGTEKATHEEMLMMKDAGYDVIYTCITPMGRYKELLESAGFTWYSCNYRGPMDVAAFFRIWSRIKSVKAMRIILVAHNIFAMLCLLMQRKKSITYLRHHYHHFGNGTLPFWKWWVTYAIASISVRKTAYVCNHIRDEALQIWPSLKKNSTVIYNIFRIQAEVSEDEKKKARRELGITENAYVIGGAGRFEPVKRWDVWCEVIAKVFEKEAMSAALVVGNGSDKYLIKKYLKKYTGRFYWPGLVSDMSTFYKAIDVLLFVSDFDATPRVPMEALSFGRPIVVSLSKGGLMEILPQASTFVTRKHDIGKLTEMVCRAQDNHDYNELKIELEKLAPQAICSTYCSWLDLKSK